jgi:hypothetical protein
MIFIFMWIWKNITNIIQETSMTVTFPQPFENQEDRYESGHIDADNL